MRVLFAGAMQAFGREAFEPMVLRIEPGVLPGQDERRRQPALGERGRDGRQLDRFRPGPDDQPDVGGIQSSP
jgi:hypothetical protein